MKMIDRRGVWRLYDRHTTLILTDEKQLERIAYAPDEPLFDDEDRGFSGERHGLYPKGTTLDSFMADAAQRGCTRVSPTIFSLAAPRAPANPDSEITVKAYQVICEKARAHGMTFGASLISPLDLGGGYAKTHENTGRTWQMAEADLQDGHFSLEMREQMQWYNNKGPIALRLTRLMAYAFDEERLGDSANFYVNAAAMEDITPSVRFERLAGTEKVTGSGYGYRLMRVSGDCGSAKGHVMVLAEYATPELDYFADNALPYIQSVVDLHAQNGIAYEGFYSDEMHIQFDWDLNEHFGPTEIRTRYVTPSLIREYAARYGEKYPRFRALYGVLLPGPALGGRQARAARDGPRRSGHRRNLAFPQALFRAALAHGGRSFQGGEGLRGKPLWRAHHGQGARHLAGSSHLRPFLR